MDASKSIDAYGCLPGHAIEQADAEQAYVQAHLLGPPLYISLPPDFWPDHWKKKGYKNPVCRLQKALYGHPDSGTFWEKHCHEKVTSVGFTPIRNWSSCYYHPELRLFLLVYVDDFKMAGPRDNLKKGWALLKPLIDMDEAAPLALYLGCHHKVHRSGKTTTLTYSMKQQLEATIAVYESECKGIGKKFNP